MGVMKHDEFQQLYLLETKSRSYARTLEFCRKAASSNANILLSGESGTGKEILAQYIHYTGKRSEKPFVAVNCSSYADTLLESELFGHEQGAFTGATSAKKGKLELSNGGTLLLDEVGDISLQTQIKLLRVIETKLVERIGSNDKRYIDFRLVSATNVDLQDAIASARFREDFFYRISTIVIYVPPLRERREDLPSLIAFFLRKCSRENGIEIRSIAPEVEEFLHNYDYPGNIRELKNIVERMVVFSTDGVVTRDGLPVMHSYYRGPHDAEPGVEPEPFRELIPFQTFKHNAERAYLSWALEQCGGNVTETARRLSLSPRQLHNKIRDLEIKK